CLAIVQKWVSTGTYSDMWLALAHTALYRRLTGSKYEKGDFHPKYLEFLASNGIAYAQQNQTPEPPPVYRYKESKKQFGCFGYELLQNNDTGEYFFKTHFYQHSLVTGDSDLSSRRTKETQADFILMLIHMQKEQ